MPRRERPASGVVVALVTLAVLTGHGQEPAPLVPQPELVPAEPAWTVTLDALPVAPGAVDSSGIYVQLQSGQLVALARDDGRVRWTIASASAVSPLTGDGHVFALTSSGVRAFDAATGAERWSVDVGRSLDVPLARAGDRLILAVEPATLVALSLTDGTEVWRQALPAAPARRPAGDSRFVYAALLDDTVVALAQSDGAVRWTRRLGDGLTEPALVDNRVVVGIAARQVFALDAASGTIAWRWRVGGSAVGAAGNGDRVFFVALDNVLRAVNHGNGNQRWKSVMAMRPAGAPLAVGDIVIVTGTSPTIMVHEAATGEELGTYVAPSELEGPPLVLEPAESPVGMAVLTRDGRVVGLRLAPPAPPPVARPASDRAAPAAPNAPGAVPSVAPGAPISPALPPLP